MVRVLGLCGSLREASHNKQLLLAAARELPADVTLEVYSGLRDIPPYDEDVVAPESVNLFRRAIAEANCVLVATPEYNASVPGQLKNALDWASRPFPDNALRGKPVAVIGASTGMFGAVWAQAEVRKVLKTIGADVLDDELPVANADTAFADDLALADQELQAALADIVGRLLLRTGSQVL
ncbi:NAD(P)H-dependent oxidoreductase [Lentzea pudingi]|uniref:NAD(P)H-dependent oxidoreductase n=1 Tax=Lentzea pudingi TaxID=1789439 RepID=A0ABQ2IS52_9PSEU|nr:NAD(P)H-dependent oxidoreductase [Lentzea pudingi]GGN28672.1 NAD(P)H-dependent oxidoreductase [Lentzea pudingi]